MGGEARARLEARASLMDAYETRWRARAAAHDITDVDWYVYLGDGEYERHADLATAERRALEIHGEPACGRGAHCADIAPHLCGEDSSGNWSAVDALLAGEYEDDD